MKINKYVDEYIKAWENGKIIFNKDRIRLIEYLRDEIFVRDDIYFDDEMIDKYIKFSEKNFFPLAKYQKFIAPFIFLFFKEDNEVFFDEFLITVGRGGGKNGFMSTRGAFFISPLHGIRNYNVTITANSENQGKVSFKEVYETVQLRQLGKHYYLTKTAITGKYSNSIFSYRTNNPETMDGARDGALEFDEIHQFETSASIDVQRSGLGKIQHPRTFYNGTNGYIREGFYDRILERADNIFSRKSKNDMLFPFICRIDDLEEMHDYSMWSKANPMFEENTPYSNRLFNTVKKEYLKLEEEPSGRREFIVKRMNFTEGDGERDVAPYEQIQETNRPIPELKNKSCVAGFDYASIRDFASVGLLFKVNGEFIWLQHTFVRKGFLEEFKLKAPIQEWAEQGLATIVTGDSIDPAYLVQWLAGQRENYEIEIVVADNFRMDLLKPLLEEEGFTHEFIRNIKGVQAKVAPIIEDGFAKRRFIFGDDPMMRWYVRNSYIKEDSSGNRTFLKKEPLRRKTDGFHAFIAALYKRELISDFDIKGALKMLNEMNF